MKKYEINGYKRINKTEARKLFNSGAGIVFCPYKLRPGAPWYPGVYYWKTGLNFDAAVAAFEYYNCNSETGKYTAFYLDTATAGNGGGDYV